MKMSELRQKYLEGKIDKKLYFQLMRENYLRCLSEVWEVLAENPACEKIVITKDDCVLKKSDGCSLLFDFTQSICRAEVDIILEGDPEKNDMEYIGNYLSERQDAGCILDIGANVGLFSIYLYKNNNGMYNYYLFEPVPSTFELLKRTIALNEINVEHFNFYNMGMSDKKGSFDFFVPASNEAASLVANTDEFYCKRSDQTGGYTGSNEIEVVKCDVSTVDSFVSENKLNNIKFIKIDVEGNEKFVLEGAKKTLTDNSPLIYCELLRKHAKRFGYHPNDVIDFMKRIGYKCYILSDNVLSEVLGINEETVETNFFFIKNNQLLPV